MVKIDRPAVQPRTAAPAATAAPKAPRTGVAAGRADAGVAIALSPRAQASLTPSGPGEAAARAIMQGHNLRAIRYTDLVALADQLQQTGALRAEDYLDFIGPSPEHARLDGTTDPTWNDPQDRLAVREQQLAFLKASHAEQRFIDFAAYHLSLMQYLQSLRAA